jgi:hypothetical protein
LEREKAGRMTLEAYEKAKDIVIQIKSLDTAIADLKFIMSNDTSRWLLEVRPNPSHTLHTINHYGILPEILQTILSKHIEERKKLVDELAKL